MTGEGNVRVAHGRAPRVAELLLQELPDELDAQFNLVDQGELPGALVYLGDEFGEAIGGAVVENRAQRDRDAEFLLENDESVLVSDLQMRSVVCQKKAHRDILLFRVKASGGQRECTRSK